MKVDLLAKVTSPEVSRGVLLSDEALVGNLDLDGSPLLQLEPVPASGILLQLRVENGADLDARVDSSMSVEERELEDRAHPDLRILILKS